MRYETFTYLWPPRPEQAIPRQLVAFYERRNWVGQIKMNGTCSVLAISPNKNIRAMNRQNEKHKLWEPTDANVLDFSKLPGNGWYVFVAELMHSKVPGIRNVNYINEILVADGEYLVGSKFMERQEILKNLFLKGKKSKSREMLGHWEITPTLWLAKTFQAGFGDIFDGLNRPEHEGIVLKDPNTPLALCLRKDSNVKWQVKMRRPHDNYSY